MKVECHGEKLKNAVMSAERVTGKNLALPVLGAILFIASGKTLKLRATNLSLGIEIEIPAKIEKEGVVAVKGSIVSGFFSTLTKNDDVKMTLDNENLVITTKTNKVTIKAQNHDDFPTIPFIEGHEIKIPAKVFIDGIKSVYYSASVSDIKPEISSVFIHNDGEYLVFAATDSFRLAEKKLKVRDLGENVSILIPHKNVIDILRIIPEDADDLTIRISKNQIAIVLGDVYITSRVIDGNFPDYKQIIPKEFTTEVITLKSDLISALKVSNIFSDKFNQITLSSKPPEKSMSIYARNSDIGETTAKVSASSSGNPIEVNLNFKYFIDCLQSINKESVLLRASAPNKPMLVGGAGDHSFTYLIMPMNR